MKLRYLPFFLSLFLVPNILWGQEGRDSLSFGEVVSGLFRLQEYYFPQEKAHVHLDRNHYVAGDTIWLRGYLVNSTTHRADTLSRYFYVDLVDPAESVSLRAKIRRTNGVYSGYLPLPDDMREGHYTLRAYSLFMRNSGEDYFFQTPILVSDPLALKTAMEISFPEGGRRNQMSAEIRFKNILSDTSVHSNEITFGVGTKRMESFYSDRNGLFTPSFQIPDQTKRSVLRLNYEKSRRFIEIPPPEDVFDVSFFPEGGYLLQGTACNVGFKALDAYGLGEKVSGKVTDQAGNIVASFDSQYKGMGSFYFIPEAGKQYYAECTNSNGFSRRFELPLSRNDALALRVFRRDRRLIVSVGKPAGFETTRPLFLVIHTRGALQSVLEMGNGNQPVYIDHTSLPSGISSILLLDEERNLLSERLVFCLNNDLADVGFSTGKGSYGTREKVEGKITLSDGAGNPLEGSFSVAVTDDRDVQPDSAFNILTNLLLASELKGYIESPAWYFSGDPAVTECLDQLMLTQGWKRYDIPEMLKGNLRYTDLKLEEEISGRVTTVLPAIPFKPSANTDVYLMAQKAGMAITTKTDENGSFNISNIDFPDSTVFFVQALSKKGNNRVELKMNPIYVPNFPGIVPALPKKNKTGQDDLTSLSNLSPYYNYITKADQRWVIENGMRTIYMEALTITASTSEYGEYIKKTYDETYFSENDIQTFENFLDHNDSNIEYDGDSIRFLVNARNTGEILFIIDDWVMDTTFDWKVDLDFREIKSIGIINGVFASGIDPERDAEGAFVITTKSGMGIRNRANIVMNRVFFNPLGFQPPAEFYSPRYDTALKRNSNKPDLRTTIYWNPDIKTSESGEVSFSFYTADANTTYSVVVEGISEDGKIIRAVEKIGVN